MNSFNSELSIAIQIFASIFAFACAGIIHDHPEPLEAETDHSLKVSHEHATSHQSFKLHHYHAVPVYIKDHHLVKSPIEIGGLKHVHKVSERNIFRLMQLYYIIIIIVCHMLSCVGAASERRTTSRPRSHTGESHRRKGSYARRV